MSAVAIAACEVQVSAANSQTTVPTVATGDLTLTLTLTSENLSLYTTLLLLMVLIQPCSPCCWHLDSNYLRTRCRQSQLRFVLSPLLLHPRLLGTFQSDIPLSRWLGQLRIVYNIFFIPFTLKIYVFFHITYPHCYCLQGHSRQCLKPTSIQLSEGWHQHFLWMELKMNSGARDFEMALWCFILSDYLIRSKHEDEIASWTIIPLCFSYWHFSALTFSMVWMYTVMNAA